MLHWLTHASVRRRHVIVKGIDQMVSTSRHVAFEKLFREHYPASARAAQRVVGCQSAAEDLATEAFAQLFRESGQIEHPVGWLNRCVVRSGLDYLQVGQTEESSGGGTGGSHNSR